MYFTVRSEQADVEIMIYREGGFIDHCEDWDAISPEDLDEAFTLCLDYVLAHPAEATALGLDVNLLEELWR